MNLGSFKNTSALALPSGILICRGWGRGPSFSICLVFPGGILLWGQSRKPQVQEKEQGPLDPDSSADWTLVCIPVGSSEDQTNVKVFVSCSIEQISAIFIHWQVWTFYELEPCTFLHAHVVSVPPCPLPPAPPKPGGEGKHPPHLCLCHLFSQ